MLFYVERNVLTDDTGKIVPQSDPGRISYTIIEMEDVEAAVRTAAEDEQAEILYDVYRMSPEQAKTNDRKTDLMAFMRQL